MLKEEISKILDRAICDSDGAYAEFLNRLKQDKFTRDEDPRTHFCVYFLPFNPQSKKFFIVHHKKSGLWLAPGGHIDEGESLLQALNRELAEELGLVNHFADLPSPFLLTVTPIENPIQPCKLHFDIWCLVPTDGQGFNVDPREFLDTKWLTIEEARKIVIDPANIKALELIAGKNKESF